MHFWSKNLSKPELIVAGAFVNNLYINSGSQKSVGLMKQRLGSGCGNSEGKMKMNPVNIPFHEAGHVVVCQELNIPMTEAVVTDSRSGVGFDRNKGLLCSRLCAFVAGHVAEHLFGVEDGRFPLISGQVDHPEFKEYQDSGDDDLAEANHYASVLSKDKLKSIHEWIVDAEERARSILQKHGQGVKAIADELRRLRKVTDRRAKELMAQPPS